VGVAVLGGVEVVGVGVRGEVVVAVGGYRCHGSFFVVVWGWWSCCGWDEICCLRGRRWGCRGSIEGGDSSEIK